MQTTALCCPSAHFYLSCFFILSADESLLIILVLKLILSFPFFSALNLLNTFEYEYAAHSVCLKIKINAKNKMYNFERSAYFAELSNSRCVARLSCVLHFLPAAFVHHPAVCDTTRSWWKIPQVCLRYAVLFSNSHSVGLRGNSSENSKYCTCTHW